jgi:hypothetical protein
LVARRARDALRGPQRLPRAAQDGSIPDVQHARKRLDIQTSRIFSRVRITRNNDRNRIAHALLQSKRIETQLTKKSSAIIHNQRKPAHSKHNQRTLEQKQT